MDNNAQPTAKQNAIEALRSAESVVITTAKNPTRDQIAAAIGLHLLLVKLDKVAEVVVRKDVPKELSFLPSDFINNEIQGQRDFIIQLDQSKTEADRLKYLTEDGKLKVYITPYNGLYSKDDVSFEYGDYHCDAIVGLGTTSVGGLDSKLSDDPKLTENAKFIFIASEGDGGGPTSWVDQGASSVCEMVMSMSEALGSGMMDRDIATALFTGIVDKTEHFTNSATSPKVMTMAAQLLAAGANQAEVVKRLSVSSTPPVAPTPSPQMQSKAEETRPAQNPTPAGQPQSPPAPAPAPAPAPEEPKNEFQLRKAHDEPSTSQQPTSSSGEVNFHNDQPAPTQTQSLDTGGAPQASAPRPTADNRPQPSAPAFTGTVGASVSMPQAGSTPPPNTPASSPPPATPPPVPPPLPSPLAPPAPSSPPTTPPQQPPQSPPAPQQSQAQNSEDSFAMPRELVLQPPSSAPQVSSPSNQDTSAQPASDSGNMSDVEAARRALEQAHKSQSPPQQPPGSTSS